MGDKSIFLLLKSLALTINDNELKDLQRLLTYVLMIPS